MRKRKFTNRRSKAVIKMNEAGDVIAQYVSITEAAEKNDIHFQNIWRVCQGLYKTSLKGFYYKWKDLD